MNENAPEKKEKSSIIKKWWFWAIIAMVLIYVVVPKKPAQTVSASPTAVPTVAATQTLKPTATPEPQLQTPAPEASDRGATPEEAAETIEIISSEYLGGINQKVDLDKANKIVTVSMWDDGITYEALAAMEGSEEYKKDWDEASESIVCLNESTLTYLKSMGLSDYHCVHNILNDVNTDNVLLTVMNGVVIYDAVNESGLLN